MSANILSKKDYLNLGMRLVSEKPSIAHELLSVKYPEPLQTDVSMIPEYYQKFATIRKPPLKRGDLYDFRILFISCIIHLYQPCAYLLNLEVLRVKRGLVYELCGALNTYPSNVSAYIRNAIIAHKVYSDFRDEVEKIMEVLK